MRLSRKHFAELPDLLPGHPWYALVQADDCAGELGARRRARARARRRRSKRGRARDATIAQSGDQANALWALRENIAEAQRREGPNIKHDISLPVSAMPAFLAAAADALTAAFPGLRFVIFGHLGDGNLHYNLAAPEGVAPEAFLAHTDRANRIVHDLVTAHGGSISAEHGIGQQKRAELVRYKSAVELELMRGIKAALDPAGILNPGKVL